MKSGVQFVPEGTVTSAKGFTAGAALAGINKARHNPDLSILFCEAPCATAGVFTLNKITAAPVKLCRERLPSNRIRAVVVNSGCANAGTGEPGLGDALDMAALAADHLGVPPDGVLVASTGIIGQRLPLELIKNGIKEITLSGDGGHQMARAIMTTDTVPKEVAVEAEGGEFIIGGIAKGSGMIHPQMGTMLCFLATDARVDMDFLAQALGEAVDTSFNMVSIDGDTSPNDTVLLMANGLAGGETIGQNTRRAPVFQQALDQACIFLAKAIARDGEGASRLIEVTVDGAASATDARLAAKAVVSSSLVKTAVHGGDPNWGRIIAAVGRSGAQVLESELDLSIGGTRLVKGGMPLLFDRNKVARALKNEGVSIELNLHLGGAKATAWGCDLSPEYAAINSQYTT